MQILHRKPYHFNAIDETTYSPEVFERENKLRLYQELVAEACSQKLALKAIGISRATFYRWKKGYEQYGFQGLEKENRSPKNKRKPSWTRDDEKLVKKVRMLFPLWGKYKIKVILEREYNKKLSNSTVGRIILKLLKLGQIKPVRFYCGLVKKRKRVFNRHEKRWKYVMKTRIPEELIQIDHASIELGSGKIIKHFQAICPITKIFVEKAYQAADSKKASDFFEHVRSNFPFKIKSVQVDGGTEFMKEFEESCKKNSVDLFVLPPRSPKYNGHVERANGTAKYEFYWQYSGSEILEILNKNLKRFVEMYNTFRPHQGLHYKTPMEYYQQLVAS